jgi:adenosine deaminase
MLEVVRREGLDLPREASLLRPLVQVTPSEDLSFQNFLSKFAVLRSFYTDPAWIERFVTEAIEDAAADHIRYLELRFTPVALAQRGRFSLAQVVDWVIEAKTQAVDRFEIEVGLIVSMNRHEPVSLADQVMQVAVDRKGKGILGVDLAGNEAEFSPEPFLGLFAEAKREGLGVTVHAGEWAGAQSVRFAIAEMDADRIGHGVRVMEDKDAIAIANERRIPFEVCLSSNLHSGVVEDIHKHSILAMMDSGLQVTLNTDDPGVSDICLSDEYELAVNELGLSLTSMQGLILTGVQGAFLEPKKKAKLERSFRDAFFREVAD